MPRCTRPASLHPPTALCENFGTNLGFWKAKSIIPYFFQASFLIRAPNYKECAGWKRSRRRPRSGSAGHEKITGPWTSGAAPSLPGGAIQTGTTQGLSMLSATHWNYLNWQTSGRQSDRRRAACDFLTIPAKSRNLCTQVRCACT